MPEEAPFLENVPHIEASHVVPSDAARSRLDQYIPLVFPQIPTRSAAGRVVKKGRILLDGKAVEGSRFVKPGQKIDLLEPAKPPPIYDISLEVCYEDLYLAVVVKPPGISVSGNRFKTLEHALIPNLTATTEIDKLPWPYPVHRLDVRTSGLVIVAKTRKAMANLSLQFEKRQVFKRYEALAAGPIEGEGMVDLPVDGRAALSHYKVEEQSRSLHSGYLSRVTLWPKTGRTHQLRQHLASLESPILGDDLYGKAPILRGSGLFLAAVELKFTHPVSKETVHVSWPAPKKFRTYLDREQRRWERVVATHRMK